MLGVPCLTLRENTERPVTLRSGTNVLVGSDPDKIIDEFSRVLQRARPKPATPQLWDGQAARRIIQVLCHELRPSQCQAMPSRGDSATGNRQVIFG